MKLKKKNLVEQPHVRKRYDLRKVKKCGARTRAGKPCLQPAMKNGRCRLHGGKSTGPPQGNKNAQKHGFYSREKMEMRRMVRSLIGQARDLIKEFESDLSA